VFCYRRGVLRVVACDVDMLDDAVTDVGRLASRMQIADLKKVGMRKIGEVIDPSEHDGPIWRWQIERSDMHGCRR
jgi:hypothetical protein